MRNNLRIAEDQLHVQIIALSVYRRCRRLDHDPAKRILVTLAFTVGMFFGFLARSHELRAEGEALVAQAKPAQKPKAPAKRNAPPPAAVPGKAEEEPDDGPAVPAPPVQWETVKLAKGAKVRVEKWGDTFEAYEYRPPVNLVDKNVQNLGDIGYMTGLQIDPKGGKFYWAEPHGESAKGQILRCNLDGKQITSLVQGLVKPGHLAIDPEHGRIYWIDGDPRKATLKAADLNGKNVTTVAEARQVPMGLAVDPDRSELYYWEEPGRIVCLKTDGTGERQAIGKEQDFSLQAWPHGMYWNRKEHSLFWVGASTGMDGLRFHNNSLMVRCLDQGAVKAKDLFVSKIPYSGIKYFSYDTVREQFVFVDSSYGQVLRTNRDGSEREVLVTAPARESDKNRHQFQADVTVDADRGMVYWPGQYGDGKNAFPTIYRMKLPPRLKRITRPAPPLLEAINPNVIKPGQRIEVRGKYLASVTAVSFVDDATGQPVAAQFELKDDNLLTSTVPELNDGCEHPMLIVETPSGVTMTLRRDLKVVDPEAQYTHNRLTAGPLAQVWVPTGTSATNLESAVAYVNADSSFRVGARGQTLVFVKNDTLFGGIDLRNCTIYLEPFARWSLMRDIGATTKVHHVPAIRPSFLDTRLTIQK